MKKLFFYVQISALVFFSMSGIFTGLPVAQAIGPTVLINEFNLDGTQWVELFNASDSDVDLSIPTWELVATVQGLPLLNPTTTLSGLLPAWGLLTFEVSGLPSAAPTLLSLNYDASPVYAMSYGTLAFGEEPHLAGYPGIGESVALIDNGTTWSTTTDITRGWYNEAPAPTIATIVSMINDGGIFTNMDTLTDLTVATNLYFEKRTDIGDPATALGKMTFAGPLNLTNASTTEILQNLGAKMEAAAGSMSFDARTATDLKDAGAEISIYKINDIGYDVADLSLTDMVVKDDDGNIIDPSDENYPSLSLVSTSTNNEGTFTFTTDHFTSFGFNSSIVYVDALNEGGIEEGTEVNPYVTIQEGIDAVATGGTVYVASGTYEENIEIGKSLTLIGDIGNDQVGPGEDAPIITNMTEGYTRTVNINAENVTVRGFIVENNERYPAIRIANYITGALVKNNELRNAYVGIGFATGANGNIVTKNISHNNSYGITIGGAYGNIISYNEIYDNSSDGIYLKTGGCNMVDCVSTIGNNSINNNQIYNNQGNGIYFDSDLDTNDGIVIIDSNIISSSSFAGIYINSGTNGVAITNNTISNNGQSEGLATGIHVMSASGNSAHNNIISDDAYGVGVNNEDTDYAFDATQNYWGGPNGPYEDASNPTGNLDSSIVGNVTYSPWYSDEAMTALRGIPTIDGDEKTYTITEEYIVTNDGFDLTIPAGTDITGDSSWDGTINPPTVTTIASSDQPSRTGYTTIMRDALEVGFADGKLILSNAAKLVFPGEAGQHVGYVRPGEDFTEITTTCDENTQNWADINLGTEGDCKIDDNGDLIVWTKHFTSFATYSQTANSSGGGGGGSVVIATPCSGVTYSDWGTCVNGMQYRNLLGQVPSNCSLTTEQQTARSKACGAGVSAGVNVGTGSGSMASDIDVIGVMTRERAMVSKMNLALTNRLLGRILLQVEEQGQAWYLEPVSKKKYFMGRPLDAFNLMRKFGLGISNANLKKFQTSGVPRAFAGRIFLQVESVGEAYYVNPVDLKMHYLGRPADAFKIMRDLALGITNNDIRQISVGE